jgi:hypothetical protein
VYGGFKKLKVSKSRSFILAIAPSEPMQCKIIAIFRYDIWRLAVFVTTLRHLLIAAQYAETRTADRAARYAARANRASAPPQQHHLAQGITLDN